MPITSLVSTALTLDTWAKEGEIHNDVGPHDGGQELDADAVNAEDKDADEVEVSVGNEERGADAILGAKERVLDSKFAAGSFDTAIQVILLLNSCEVVSNSSG